MVYDVGKVLWRQLPILLGIDNRIFKICSLSKTQFDINHNERQYGRLVCAVFYKSTLRNVMITKLKNFSQTDNTCAGHCSQKIEKNLGFTSTSGIPKRLLARTSPPLYPTIWHTPLSCFTHTTFRIALPPVTRVFFHTHPYAHTSRPPLFLLSPTFLPHLPPALKFSLAQSLLRSISLALKFSHAHHLCYVPHRSHGY